MNILILDTSQLEGYVALYRGEQLLGRKTFPPKDQVKILINTIDVILSEGLITLEQVNLIKVCIGPGSFTGTRVGVITAKGLGYGAGIPVVGFHSKTGLTSDSLEIEYTNSISGAWPIFFIWIFDLAFLSLLAII